MVLLTSKNIVFIYCFYNDCETGEKIGPLTYLKDIDKLNLTLSKVKSNYKSIIKTLGRKVLLHI